MAKPAQKSYYDVWKRRVQQLGAGIAENTLVNAASPDEGSYRPAFVDQILGIPGVVKSFLPSAGKGDKPFSGDTAIERQLNRSYKGMTTAELNANKLLGTTSARNTEDAGFRYLLPSLINPKGLLKAVPKAVREGATVAKIAKVAAKTPKYITKPAKVVAELATPFRQTKLSTALPINAGIIGLTDIAMDKGVTSDGQEYDGALPDVIRAVTGRSKEPSASPEEQAAMDEIKQQMLQDSVAAGEITEDEVKQYEDTPFSQNEEMAAQQDEWVDKAKDAGIWLSAVLAGTIGGHKFKNLANAHAASRLKAIDDPANMGKFADPEAYGPHQPIEPEPVVPTPAPEGAAAVPGEEPKFTSTKYEKSDISVADRLRTGVFEAARPIISTAQKHLGRAAAKKLGFRADALTNSSIQSKFYDWLVTGRAPGTEMKTEKLSSWAEAYSSELTPDEQLRVSDALVAASSLDDHARTGNRASLFEDRYGQPTDVPSMQALVDGVKQDPKLGKYYNQIQKFYDQKLQYEVERGTMTQAAYDQMRKDRPNYVPLQSNLRKQAPYSPFGMRYSANEELKQARNVETETGVKGSEGVVNPFAMVFEDWSDAVRRAETNSFRGDFLQQMDAAKARNSQGKQIVRKVSNDATGDNLHYVNTPKGMETYEVLDSELAKSLHLSPRNAIPVLEETRQMFQNFTTGALATPRNLFGLVAAPIMDSMAASSLAGKSHTPGMANRLFFGGHLGGVRAAGDALAREAAIKLRTHMIRENSWLKSALGPNGLDKLTTVLENHYKNTTLAQMDQMGITSHAAWGAADPTHVMQGIEGTVPGFARGQANATIADINEALDNGDIGKMRAAMSKSGNRLLQAKTLPFLRHYGSILESMHNGARYSAVRANKGKVKDLDEFISDMRRLSADPAIHGSSKLINGVASANLYGPISLATMGQVGKRFREDPLNFARNFGQTGMTAAAMFYLSQAYDPEARDAHNAKTPQQKANKLSLAGGAELPLDQLLRLQLGAVMPFTDQISGLNEGNFDPNFLKVMENWIEGDTPQMDENSWKDFELRMNEALKSNSPTSLVVPQINMDPKGGVGWDVAKDTSSIPLVGALAAYTGLDPGMSRLTGEPVVPRVQEMTGQDKDEDRPDSLTNSFTEVMLRTLFSSVGTGVLDIADDMWRVTHDKDPSNDKRAVEMGLDQWKEGAQKGAGPLKPLFGDRTQLKSAADVNYALLKDREKGIEDAVNFLTRDYRTGSHSGASRSTARIARKLDPSATAQRVDINGTEALRIGSSAKQITGELNKAKQRINQISAEIDSFKIATDKTQAEKNKLINERVDEIKYRRMHMLESVRRHEATISKLIGRPFTFEEYNGDEYMNPYTATHQE